jgi:hypothetical protein
MAAVTPDNPMHGTPARITALKEQDVIVLSPIVEGREAWRDYSAERGNESGLIASLPYGGASSLCKVGRHTHSDPNWNLHGLWRG